MDDAHPPNAPIIRYATQRDLAFVDALQKQFSNNVGFLPAPALRQYQSRSAILIAEANQRAIGYLLGRHALAWQPLLRPIFQLCIAPAAQRNHHAVALIVAWQNLAKLAGQVGIQANCADDISAHTFWATQGFKFICKLETTNKRHRQIIVWRKPLTSQIPRWFIKAPTRAGHQARRQGEIL